MCGIGGIFPHGARAPSFDLRRSLAAMARAQAHRGPDDEGIYCTPDGRGGLINRRLAIRDPSPAGHMPMQNGAGTVCVTYNGEIYNAGALRSELAGLGYRFTSHSDTEVILHGYEAWGAGAVSRLRGIFAFAILDRRRRPQLFMARDPLGVKPLYYARTSDAFLFASELNALRATGLIGRDVDPAGLVGYLMLGAVPNPSTILRDVRSLEAGCTLTLELDGPDTAASPARYWRLPAEVEPSIDAAEAVEQVRELLEDAVRSQLVSDVPLGAFLSGGLDSSAVVALMRKATSGPIRTCSMVFDEAGYSEAPYARAMAQAAGAEHHERTVTAQDVARELDHIFASMDQPTIDGVNTFFVAQTAREAGLTVALSGLGGDDLFGGYDNTFRGVPQMLRALRIVQAVPGGSALARQGTRALPPRQRWARTLDALSVPASPAGAYLTRRGLFSPSEARALVAPDIWEAARQAFDPVQYVATRAGRNGHSGFDAQPFAWTSRAELGTYTHNQLLRDTDVMSMAHSLEVRVPLLDHKLVEAVLRLPAEVKRSGHGPKPLLRASLDGALPAVVGERRDKQGFVFPLDRWMRGPLRSRIASCLEPGTGSGWLRPAAVDSVWNEYQAGRLHWSRAWALAALHAAAGAA
jgi:asparagine synthase (glutamine-hydrolysing)